MRIVNVNVLNAADNQSTNGNTIDSNQLISVSFQAYFGDTQAAGTFKLQGSNDIYTAYYNFPEGTFQPTNWTDIPNQSASITSGGSALLTINQSCYRWLRAPYTTTGTGTQTIAPIADTGVKQHQQVTTVADVAGSLNSTYFLLSSVDLVTKAQKNFYMWFDDGAGVDPAIAGRTAIHITYSDNDSANTLATSMRTALNALTNDFTASGSGANVIITNVAAGPVTAASDGTAATGFTFGAVTAGVTSNLINKYFLLQDEASAHLYYVWMNPDSIGTDPTVAGRTGVPIVYSSGASAATIGSALATAIAALNSTNSFNTSGTTTVTVTNKTAGPFVPMSDASSPNGTGFTFAVTAGGNSTINVNMFGLSV